MFDIIIGNPPYITYHNIDEKLRSYIRNTFKTTKKGFFNLYYAFFELGYNLISNNGKLVFITPNNYVTLISAKELRKYLQENRAICKIIDFKEDQNFNAQTCTSITVLDKNSNKFIEYSGNNGKEANQISYKSISYNRWKLGLTNERKNIISIEECGRPLHSILDIKIGLFTLADHLYYFVPYKEDKYYYYIDKQFKIEKEITRPCIKIPKIVDINTDNNKIIFPYDNKGKVIRKEVIKAKFPECYRYLTNIKQKLNNRNEVIKPFYAYGRNQALLNKGMKLLTPTYSKKPRFTLDINQERYYLNGRGLYLKENASGLFSSKVSDLIKLSVYGKILNSCIMDYYVKRNSHIIRGGYYSYQKKDIKNFSICDLTDKEMLYLHELNNKQEIDKFLEIKYDLHIS